MATFRSQDDQNNIEQIRTKVRAHLESATLYNPEIIAADKPLPVLFIKETIPLAISYPCRVCKSEETTTWRKIEPEESSKTTIEITKYRCLSCSQSEISFWLRFEVAKQATATYAASPVAGASELKITKAGQWPRWSIRISKRLRKALGDATLPLFEKGLACMAEGLGIGAAAYFRRVVEDKVDDLLALVEHTAKLENDAEVLKSIAEARTARDATERLRLAARQLPAILRPGDQNPLRIIYSSMSGPLHSETEKTALELAQVLLDSFIFLFENLDAQLEAAEKFRAAMQAAGDRLGKMKS